MIRSRSDAAGDLVQHHDVATVRVVQPVRQLVDEHPVVVVQRGDHRRPVDDEVGEHERADEEGDEQGDADDDDPVEERPAAPGGGVLVGLLLGLLLELLLVPRLDDLDTVRVAVVVVGRDRLGHAVLGHSDSISFSTRSSRLRNGSLQSTVRCAWSLSLRCTQSTV